MKSFFALLSISSLFILNSAFAQLDYRVFDRLEPVDLSQRYQDGVRIRQENLLRQQAIEEAKARAEQEALIRQRAIVAADTRNEIELENRNLRLTAESFQEIAVLLQDEKFEAAIEYLKLRKEMILSSNFNVELTDVDMLIFLLEKQESGDANAKSMAQTLYNGVISRAVNRNLVKRQTN